MLKRYFKQSFGLEKNLIDNVIFACDDLSLVKLINDHVESTTNWEDELLAKECKIEPLFYTKLEMLFCSHNW